MKKRIMMFTAMALLAGVVSAGCSKPQTGVTSGSSTVSSGAVSAVSSASVTVKTDEADKKLSVVCTIFPGYDWVRKLVGDKADKYEITYLLNKGVDVHSYQPTADDIVKISGCDMFVYVGGESDTWAEDVLKTSTNPNMQVVKLTEVVGDRLKAEEVVEGMQEHEHEHAEEDHEHEEHEAEGHEHEEHEEHDHEHEETVYDEHVWLSLRNASSLVNEIAARLQILDSENKDVYALNAADYTSKLTELDAKYRAAIKKAKKDTVLFGDRFPFRYLVDDYGLKYYAAFVGCSAETEASFETVAFLANKTEELELSSICVIEKSDQKIAKTVSENTKTKNQNIVVLNSMQSVTAEEAESGASYLGLMEENLKALETALK